MNLVQIANDLKNLSDEQLSAMMQNPSPQAPEYLVLTEQGRRDKIRKEYGGQPQPSTTVAEELNGAAPPMGAPPPPGPMGEGLGAMPPPPEMMPPQGFSRGGGVEPIIRSTAERYGIPYNEFYRAAQIESSLNPSAKNETSSAAGLFQQLDSNWSEWGKGGDRYDPAQSADAAARFWRSNKNYLEGKLGRELRPGELYLAHQQGPGGALKLLSNPNAPASSVVGAKAVSLNGGNPNMTAAEFAGLWTKKAAGGDRDPQAASMSYGTEDDDDGGISSLLSPSDSSQDDEDSVFGGLEVIEKSKEKQKESMEAGKEAAAQVASAPDLRAELSPEQFMPEKRAGTFASGGEVRGFDGGGNVYADPEDQGIISWFKRVFGNPVDEEDVVRPPGYVDPVQTHRSQAFDRESPGGEERKGAGLTALPPVPGEVYDGSVLTGVPDSVVNMPDRKEFKAPANPPSNFASSPMPELPGSNIATTDVPEDFSGDEPPGLFEGMGGILEQIRASRGDPYADLQKQIAAMGSGENPDADKWDDLARFGFALASTGNAGDAGLAMMSARDKRDASRTDMEDRRLDLNARLAEARARADAGDYDLAARLYAAELGLEGKKIAAAGKGAAGLSPKDRQNAWISVWDKVKDQYMQDPMFQTLPPEQQKALVDAETSRIFDQSLQGSGAPGVITGEISGEYDVESDE